ncbi:unnamed protein product, partial [Rotaria sordida]
MFIILVDPMSAACGQSKYICAFGGNQ